MSRSHTYKKESCIQLLNKFRVRIKSQKLADISLIKIMLFIYKNSIKTNYILLMVLLHKQKR